ncbi:MAG: hypothetical protein JSR66_20230 [Proteobacteria bacterium]|nr:hypothetical protein [Pseudomonadota bacterium]
MRLFVAMAMAALVAHAAGAATNSWTSIGPYGGEVLRIAYNRASPSLVYLTSVAGFSRSTDGGMSWQMVFTDSMNSPVDLTVDPSNPYRLYVVFVNPPFLMTSSDAGRTLTPVANFPVNLVNPYQVQVGADGQTLYVTAGNRIVCSTDRGQSWSERTVVDLDTSRRVLKLIIDPADSNTLYAGVYADSGSNGIYVTHDGARTWTQSFWSTNDQHYAKDIAISSLDSGTVWMAAYDGIWVSHDRAVTWARSNFAAYPGYGASAVAIDPRNPAIIYGAGPFGLIKKSMDGGSTWTDVTGNNFVEQPWTLAVHPASSGAVLVGGLGGVWGTTNDGLSWSSQVQGLVAQDVLRFSASAATDRIYFNTNSSFVGFVAGGASSATSINEDAIHQLAALNISYAGSAAYQVSSVMSQPGPTGNLYVSLFNGLAISPDGGNSWSLKSVAPPPGSQQLQQMVTWPGLPQTILAAGNTAVYRSADGGNLWSAVSGLPSGTTFGGILTAPSDSTVAYGVPYNFGANPGSYGLYHTRDSGMTWAPVGSGAPTKIYPSAIDPKDALTLYATNDSDFLKTTDGGASFKALNWDKTLQGLPYAVAIDPVNTRILYAASVIRISRSVDGGSSWQVLPGAPAAPTGSYWIASDVIVDPNRPSDLLVGTGRNGIFKMTVAPDLALGLQASGSLVFGIPFTYQYKAVNKGPYDATAVHVAVSLPGVIQNPAVSSTDGSCTVTNGTADCLVPVLRTSASFTATVSAVAPTVPSVLQISGRVSGDQPDSDGTNNVILTQTQVTDGADLSVTATAPATAQAGSPVDLVFRVSNSGPGSASGVVLTYQAASGTTVSGASATAGNCTVSNTGLVSCSLGSLPLSTEVTITVTAAAASAGTLTSTATVTSATADPVTANGSASSSTAISDNSGSSGSGSGGSDSGSKGGGGGGAISLDWIVALSLMLLWQRRHRPNR